MKQFYFIVFILLLFSCNQEKIVVKEIELEKQNIVLKFKIPVKFDVYQKEFKKGNCDCLCESINYRFSNSKFDNSPKLDTIPQIVKVKQPNKYKRYSFVISHNACENTSVSNDLNFEKELELNVQTLKEEQPQLNFTIDEKKVIDKRIFRVLGYKENLEKETRNFFTAYTYVNGKLLKFNGYLINPIQDEVDNSDFLNEIYKILKSIKFQK